MSRQNGSALIMASVGIATTLLIGLLGWVFYNAYMNHGVESDNKDSSMNMDANMDMDCLKNEGFCMTVSEAWSAKKTKTSYPSENSQAWKDNGNKSEFEYEGLELTSPDKNLTIHISTGIGQVGGLCENNDHVFITQRTVKTSIKNAQQNTSESEYLYAVAGVVQKADATFVPVVILTDSPVINEIGEHPVCSAGYADLFTQKSPLSDSATNMRASTTSELINSSPDPSEPGSSKSDALSMLKGTNYTEAFDILKSAHYME